MDEKTNMRQKAIALTLIMMLYLISGVAGVFAIDYEWNNNFPTENLFELDDNANFPIVAQDDTFPTNYYYDLQTSQRVYKDSYPFQFNRTAIWLGNNTYSMAVNTTDGADNSAYYVVSIPNLKSWTISDLFVNMSKNTDPDLTFTVAIYHYNSQLSYTDPINTIFQSTTVGSVSGTEYSTHYSIPLGTAISIADNANEYTNSVLVISIRDSSHDGLTGYAWTMDLEIHGQKISNVSITDTAAWVLIALIVIGWLMIYYIADKNDLIPKIDAGKYRANNPEPRKTRTKKTKTGKKAMSLIPIASIGVFGGLNGAGIFGVEMVDILAFSIYFVPAIAAAILITLAAFDKLRPVIAIMFSAVAFLVAYMFQPFYEIIITPIINAIWYHYSWYTPSYLPIIGMVYLATITIIIVEFFYNLWITRGETGWL